MERANTNNERKSDSERYGMSAKSSAGRGNVLQRLLPLSLMTICLLFAGAQTTPSILASATCDIVCGDPFIDPNDGQCYQLCCPEDEKCKVACELRPCK
jgi:hypothetical protein